MNRTVRTTVETIEKLEPASKEKRFAWSRMRHLGIMLYRSLPKIYFAKARKRFTFDGKIWEVTSDGKMRRGVSTTKCISINPGSPILGVGHPLADSGRRDPMVNRDTGKPVDVDEAKRRFEERENG